ncbi:MAG: PEGA domain-containing protein [Alistipes sp.]|nr:PEGA domain-containing protein [Alistipes sp.]
MKKLLSIFVALFVFAVATAQEEHSIIIDQSSFRAIQSDALTGVAIDPIGKDSSRRPCARLKVKINRMTRTEIDGIEVKIHTNNELIKCKTAEYDNGLILEMTALPVTRFYFYHPEFGYSNEVTLKLEADKEFYIEASLNQTYSIVVNSNVIDADVYIDGAFKGRTGSNYSLTVSEVMVGEHTLRVDYGGIKHEQKIAVNKGSIQFRQVVNTEASKPQFVVFVVEPADAILMIDNSVHTLQDGATSLMLENGTYNYTISAQDYHDMRGTFTVAGAKVEKMIKLNPAYGWLSVLGSSIEGAAIFVDNKSIGVAPIKEYKLSSGEHQIRIIKELYKPYSGTVTIRDNQTTNFTPSLNSDFANVNITAPNGAEIWINGVQKGSGRWSGKLSSGVYLFEARKSNHKSSSMSQTISASSTPQSYTLDAPTPITGSLVVSGTPVMADVAVDGNNVGRLPLSLDNLLIGNHNITVSKDGYAAHYENVTIAEGKSSTITVALKKNITSPLKGVKPIEIDKTLSADALNKKGTDLHNNNDYNSAVQYFFAAAEKGHSTAQSWMGYCYEYGHGVTKDYNEAAKWYRKSADQGSSYAQSNLGDCYYYGEGVTKDYAEAVVWYRKAAEQGYNNAQYSLGWCYEKGQGISQNISEAKKWYQKAADQGHENAKKQLNGLGSDSSSSSSGRTYKVGDYYNENGLEGVVFAVSSDGRSGKIVSMTQPTDGKTAWAVGSYERGRAIGATYTDDGSKNMAIVKSISGWQTKYPAFAWCANLGSAWYLPAINELESLLFNDSLLEKVNKTIEQHNGVKLNKRGEPRWYWSSTEDGKEVKMVLMDHNKISSREKNFTDEYTFTRIRAIAKFGNGASSNSYSNNNYSSSNYSSSGRTYKVGDLYNENGLKGVVFEVSADGRSGKIVHLEKSRNSLNWSNESESKRTIGANNLYDGEKNMAAVKQVPGWKDKYPLFAYCDNLGSGWYIPAKAELEAIYKNKALIEPRLTDKFTDWYWYFSSTESNTKESGVECAYDVSMKTGGNLNTRKNYSSFARAVAKFGSSTSSSNYSSSSQKNYSNNSSDSYSYTGNRSGRVYKVGDIYDEDGKRGVVFWTDASGRYGKIVSIERSRDEMVWASANEDCYKRHGTSDLHDGWKNMQRIKNIPNWREKFPPFAWCANLGEGWYLPTLEELWLIYKNRNLVKSKLKGRDDESYYSSTEVDTDDKKAFAVNVFDDVVISYNSLKFSKRYVRAVATFGSPENYRRSTHAPYKVGDYYNEDGKEGVVFQVNSTGTSGMIVSIDQGYTMWANRDQYESETKKRIKADNEDYGLDNCGVVRQISSWQNKYPAFAWCENLGNDWYLPATNELKILLRDSNVYNAVNNTLKRIGAPELAPEGETRHSEYWLSTESSAKPINGSYQACTIPMGYNIISDDFKYDQNLVRAVAKF